MTHAPWPLFDLVVTTPRIKLRYATDALLLELTTVAHDVIASGSAPFDGDSTFYDQTIAGRRRWLAGQWSARARTSPDWWVLVFAVVVDGRAVGTQEITANSFVTARHVNTFSWLTRSMQGRGIGREMREAVLHLAFDGLGAQLAVSDAFADNAASCAVSAATGYVLDRMTPATRRDEPAQMLSFVLPREKWHARRRSDVTISGLDACLPMLGLD